MKWRVILLCFVSTAALSACGDDLREHRLAQYDFADMSVVSSVSAQLDKQERGIFRTYAIQHLASSAKFCGEKLVSVDGREPVTIGDAIDFTVAREKRDAELRAAQDINNYSPAAQRYIRIEELTEARDEVIHLREIYRMVEGDPPDIEQHKQWQEFERQISEIEAKLAELNRAKRFSLPTRNHRLHCRDRTASSDYRPGLLCD